MSTRAQRWKSTRSLDTEPDFTDPDPECQPLGPSRGLLSNSIIEPYNHTPRFCCLLSVRLDSLYLLRLYVCLFIGRDEKHISANIFSFRDQKVTDFGKIGV